MTRYRAICLFMSVLLLAGCAERTLPEAVMMQETYGAPELFAVQNTQEQHLQEQAQALTEMTKEIVRSATLRGAAVGAVMGCGMSALTGSSGCVTSALAGGAVGGVTGHMAGKREVERRVEMVALSKVTPGLASARDQMALVKGGLTAMLTAQDAERAQLTERLASDQITIAQMDARIAAMRNSRSAMAESLSVSASEAKQALTLLETAKDAGQTGMDWHLRSARKLEQDAMSARSAITLL